jgi:hypothetical protein
VERAGRTETRTARVAAGTPLRLALRAIGELGEGCAVLDGARPLPLDTPVDRPRRLRLIPTFSGG